MRKRTYPVERTFNPIIQIKNQNIMATLTVEQIEQKKQLLTEKLKEMKAIYDELVEAGAIELTDEELDKAAGGVSGQGWRPPKFRKDPIPDEPSIFSSDL